MMKILLTGITGFLGSHLAKNFVESGYEVHGLIRQSSSLKRLENLKSELVLHFIEDGLDKAFEKERPYQSIVHAATCYGRHGESPLEVFNANLKFPLELIEKAVCFDSGIFINTDTFFNTNAITYSYLNDYALSKRQFLDWGKQLSQQGKIKFYNVRLEHMYGPGDDESKFVNHIVSSCLKNKPEIKLTLGEQERDFIYIDDVVSAYNLLVNHNQINNFEEYQLGSGNPITIRIFVETAHILTNSRSKLRFGALDYREHEIMYSAADIKPLNLLGWNPDVSLVDGLKKIID